MNGKRAFTLIEILVVVAIIGILSAVVLASLNLARDRGRMAAGKRFDANVYHAIGDRAESVLTFDECSGSTANDSSSLNHPGVITGATWSTDTPSGTGCSLSFGSGRYVTLPAVNIGTGPVTFSAWVKGDAVSANVEFGIFTVASANAWHFTLERSSWGAGRLNMYVGYGVITPSSFGGGTWPPSDTSWHHVAMTRDSTAMRIYFDGAQVASTNNANVTSYDVGNNVIRISYPSQTNFSGLIDEPRIYTATLTASEIQELYARGAAQRAVAVR